MSTEYGDISPRTAAHASKEFLKRAQPHLVIQRYAQTKPLPGRSSKTITFRRYDKFPATPTALTEGVTPSSRQLSATDVTATLTQYGDLVQVSDVIEDTHEDPVLNEAIGILGEQAGEMLENVAFNVIKAGTNVIYTNGSARNAVNTAVGKAHIRRAVKLLKRQNARKKTKVVRSTPDYGTEAVNAAYIAFVHPDCEGDVREIPGFVPVEKYGSMTPFESEIGKVEDVRFVTSTIFASWASAGGAAGSMESTNTTAADVYPLIIIGEDSFACVPLKGKNAVTPMVVKAKPSDSDPLAQRSKAGWKSMFAAVILNDAWMIRIECAATK